MILYAYRISMLTFVAFFSLDIIRPGFVSYYFSPLWLLVPVALLFLLAVYKRVEKGAWLWLDKFVLIGTLLLLVVSEREIFGTLLTPVLVCGLLLALLLPSLLTSTYSDEYER